MSIGELPVALPRVHASTAVGLSQIRQSLRELVETGG